MLIQFELLEVFRDGDGPAGIVAQEIGKAFGTFELTVNYEDIPRGCLYVFEPGEHLLFISVSGKTIDLFNPCFDFVVVAEDADLFFAVDDLPAEGADIGVDLGRVHKISASY